MKSMADSQANQADLNMSSSAKESVKNNEVMV
mgnify:CR=1 FL=1